MDIPFVGNLTIGVGVLMLLNVMASMYALTLFLIAFLAFDGILRLLLASYLKPMKNWGFLLFSGIVTLLLAFIIIAGLPQTAYLSLGLIFGAYLLVGGLSMIAFAVGIGSPIQNLAPR